MRDREPVAFVTLFSRALRERGLPTTPASSIDAIRALAAVDMTDKDDVYFALRSVFATRRQDFRPVRSAVRGVVGLARK